MSARFFPTILLFVLPATAADYHLSPSGNDGGLGNAGQPWKTFAHAVPLLVAGDTLHLRAGAYPERLMLSDKSGTAEAPIVIRAAENEA